MGLFFPQSQKKLIFCVTTQIGHFFTHSSTPLPRLNNLEIESGLKWKRLWAPKNEKQAFKNE